MSGRLFLMSVCVLSVCLVAITREHVLAGTTNLPNHKCYTMINGGACDKTGSGHCGPVENCQANSCWWCVNSDALPDRVCVEVEGIVCVENGDPATNCDATVKKVGTCGLQQFSPAQCICKNPAPQGNCTDVYYFGCVQ